MLQVLAFQKSWRAFYSPLPRSYQDARQLLKTHLGLALSLAVFLWHQKGVRRCLTCSYGRRQSHDRGWLVICCNRAKTVHQYLLCGKRQNRPQRFHALVEIRRDKLTPVVCLSGEPPCDPNQSSAPSVIEYNRLTPGEAKRNAPNLAH